MQTRFDAIAFDLFLLLTYDDVNAYRVLQISRKPFCALSNREYLERQLEGHLNKF